MKRTQIDDWRSYTSTLGLALLMQRVSLELLEAAHAGDADVAIASSEQLREMASALLADFGVESGPGIRWRVVRPPHCTGCMREPRELVQVAGVQLSQCLECPHRRVYDDEVKAPPAPRCARCSRVTSGSAAAGEGLCQACADEEEMRHAF